MDVAVNSSLALVVSMHVIRTDALACAFANVDIPVVDVESHQGQSITGGLMEKPWCRAPF